MASSCFRELNDVRMLADNRTAQKRDLWGYVLSEVPPFCNKLASQIRFEDSCSELDVSQSAEHDKCMCESFC